MLGGMTQEEQSGADKALRSMIRSLRNDEEGVSQREGSQGGTPGTDGAI